MILYEGAQHQTGDHCEYQVIEFEAPVWFGSTPLGRTRIRSLIFHSNNASGIFQSVQLSLKAVFLGLGLRNFSLDVDSSCRFRSLVIIEWLLLGRCSIGILLFDILKSTWCRSLVGDRVSLDLLNVGSNRVHLGFFSWLLSFPMIDKHLIHHISRNTVEDLLLSRHLTLSNSRILRTVDQGHDVGQFHLQSVLDELRFINSIPHLLYLISSKLCVWSLWGDLVVFQLGELY